LALAISFTIPAHAEPSLDPAVRAGEKMPRLHSMLVSVHDQLILEHYFHGARPETYANVKSASKSVISALVGIAIERKLLPGIETRITSYFPELAAPGIDPRKKDITIEDLLTMRSGLVDTNRGYGAWVLSPNWVHYLLARPLQSAPGTDMDYNTGNTHLLSAIVTKVTGRDTWSFLQSTIGSAFNTRIPQWPRDPQGIYFGGNDMLLTPRQMLAFGEMYLHHGRAGDRQIVPADWVDASWTPRTRSHRSGQEYGYGWWIADMAGHTTDFAWGFGGQYIFVVPDMDMVVVTTSSVALGDDRREYRQGLFELVEEQVIGALAAAGRNADSISLR
jgi:CubicO group peptidase (beta-lactamase class C family)